MSCYVRSQAPLSGHSCEGANPEAGSATQCCETEGGLMLSARRLSVGHRPRAGRVVVFVVALVRNMGSDRNRGNAPIRAQVPMSFEVRGLGKRAAGPRPQNRTLEVGGSSPLVSTSVSLDYEKPRGIGRGESGSPLVVPLWWFAAPVLSGSDPCGPPCRRPADLFSTRRLL